MADPKTVQFESKPKDPFDLEPYQHRVQQLYVQESRPLKDVIDVLKKEGCNASRNMYLRKIRSWGMEKNLKHRDMLRLLKMIDHSQNRPYKTQVFQVRGSKVTATEVLRYFRKRGEGQIPADAKVLQFDMRSSTYHSSVMPSMKLPEPLYNAQQFFQCIQTIQLSTLYMHNTQWRHQETGDKIDTNAVRKSLNSLIVMADDIDQGVWLTSKGISNLGGARLGRAFEAIRTVIQYPDRHMITMFFYALQHMYYHKLVGLAEMFARYLQQISCLVLGQTHPISRFSRLLVCHWNLFEELQLGLTVIQDTLEQACGKYHVMSIMTRFNRLLSLRVIDPPKEEIVPKYESLLKDIDHTSQIHIKLETLREYGTYLATHGEYSRGIAIIRDIVFKMHESTENKEVLRLAINSCVDYAELILDQPKLEGFEEDEEASKRRYQQVNKIMIDATEMSILKFGPGNTQTLKLSGWLTHFYMSWGATKEAKVQEEFLLQYVGEFELKQ